MKIKIISDTHGHHNLLNLEKDIDMIIHCGDSTNYKDLFRNQLEFDNFIKWYSEFDIKHKVLIAGNHDAWATKKYNIDKVKDLGITYLEHEYIEIEGLKIFGSPYTPNFCNWYFMKDRSKLDQYWKVLESDIDILVTHGPPKGMLDLAKDRENNLEFCGDLSLFNKVKQVKPKYHCFGHIHNNDNCYNQGIRVFRDITFINASVVTDGNFGHLSSQGITINYKK